MNIICVFIFLIAFFSSCNLIEDTNVRKNTHVRDEDYERIACRIEKAFARKMKSEKGLECIGTGGGMMSNIQRMAISFQYFHEVDLDQARRLLVCVANEYLNAINSCKEVRPYLHNYPFREENIQIRIWIKKPNRDDVLFNEIEYIFFVNGMLKYYLPNDEKTRAEREIHRETYEEALKIVDSKAKIS